MTNVIKLYIYWYLGLYATYFSDLGVKLYTIRWSWIYAPSTDTTIRQLKYIYSNKTYYINGVIKAKSYPTLRRISGRLPNVFLSLLAIVIFN